MVCENAVRLAGNAWITPAMRTYLWANRFASILAPTHGSWLKLIKSVATRKTGRLRRGVQVESKE